MGASTAFRPANSPYLPAPMPSPSGYTGMPTVGDIQPLGAPAPSPQPANPYGIQAISAPAPAPTFTPYLSPQPQPPNYLPFGSGTTLGPTPQHPDMKDFNFMAPGGLTPGPGGQQQQPVQQAPQQTGLSRVLDQFLGNTPSGRPQVRMFGGMGVPGLGPASLGAVDRGIQSGALPRDYRVPFRNQVGVGFMTPTFSQ